MRSFIIFTFVTLALLSSLIIIDAQVNFSPSWGKRTNKGVGMQQARPESPDFVSSVSSGPDGCKIPLESILRIQKMIQVESQKLVRCEALLNSDRKK